MNKYREVWDQQNFKFGRIDAAPWIPIAEYEPIGFWTRLWIRISK